MTTALPVSFSVSLKQCVYRETENETDLLPDHTARHVGLHVDAPGIEPAGPCAEWVGGQLGRTRVYGRDTAVDRPF
jgi:hypothetical protein